MADPTEDVVRAGMEIVTQPAQEFLSKVAGAPGSEVGAMLGDRFRFRRWRNAVRMAEKASAFAFEHGIDPQAVPLSVLFPILEGASCEEEDSMVDRWAALLANAAVAPNRVPPSFPAILREITSVEARILDAVYGRRDGDTGRLPWSPAFGSALRRGLDLDEKAFEMAMDNLVRTRLIRPRLETAHPGHTVETHWGDAYPTTLGEAFVLACQPPD